MWNFGLVTLGLVLSLVFFAFVFFQISYLRKKSITGPLYHTFKKLLPPLSHTEQEAIDAGDVYFEAELFRGCPNWDQLLTIPKPQLTSEELNFLNNQVETLCGLLNDWEITHKQLNLPAIVWEYLKKEKFFGLIIPKEFGGLGFSATANSTIIQKISTCSITAAVTAMVPNSLGPAELLIRYGTEEQKHYYLPRLAIGQEIPCFALTGPEAGSDAGAIPDIGVVCKGKFEGKEMLGINITFNKRYITLAPIATVIGLAFKLQDPEHLLGNKKDLGITVCLLPSRLAGIEIGHRHFPLNQAFLNGPIRAENLFIPIDWIIGGPKNAGKGWGMLMECLSAGRGVTLPALSTAIAKHCYRVTGAYAKIRQQFKTSIGRFEGVEERLARIAGYTYLIEATRLFTTTAIDQHKHPGVATAISKYHMTELSRIIINDAMDVHGGKGIMLGPKNYLARGYESVPISVTVEGANILTRSLIIFGQGAIRCHPYLRAEIAALNHSDTEEGLREFDRILSHHTEYFLFNFLRLIFHSATGGIFASTPDRHRFSKLKDISPSIRQLTRMSMALSFISECAFFVFGGKLKRRERLSARLGDVLSYLYIASAVIKYYHDFGNEKYDLPYVRWSLEYCLYRIQLGFLEFFRNLKNRILAFCLKLLVFPFGSPYPKPKDDLEHVLSHTMMLSCDFRDRLTQYSYIGPKEQGPIAQLEYTFQLMHQVEPIIEKIELAQKQETLDKHLSLDEKLNILVKNKILTPEEVRLLHEFESQRKLTVSVDEFEFDALSR